MINVTKTFLPEFEAYTSILKRAWDKSWITNNGELLLELEEKLKNYLGVKHLFFCSNGTVVLQMALKALNIKGDVLTTPFSYVATTNALLWEECTPVFADIDPSTMCVDVKKLEQSLTPNTQAILATHVYGYPCDTDGIEAFASKHNLKVIYDGAHAFGSVYNGKALLSYGDISTCSFHATKVFHTVEGGCIICHDDELANKLMLYRQFGHVGDEYFDIGINGKNSEFHAAMGLAVFERLPEIFEERKKVCDFYRKHLHTSLEFLPEQIEGFQSNYAYFPVLFNTENDMHACRKNLEQQGINTRRYFFPSLNTLPYLSGTSCPVSEDISARVICLPLYPGLPIEVQQQVVQTINETLLTVC